MIGHSRIHLTLLLLGMLVPGVGVCRNHTNSQRLISGPHGFFPQILRGMTWTYDQALLRQRMPASRLEDVSYTGANGEQMLDSIYSGFALKPLGSVTVEFVHGTSKRIQFINISSSEPRETCALGHPHRPRDCRNRLNRRLMKVLDRMKIHVSSFCGQPERIKSATKPGEFPKPGEYPDEWGPTYKWACDNARLILGVYSDDSGSWAVTLQLRNPAFRGGPP